MMKVVLLQEVPSLGTPGSLVEVAPGYARNYLIPGKLAIRADRGNLKGIEQHRQALLRKHQRAVEAAQKTAEKLSALTLTMAAKAGEAGRLYGSITNADIAEALAREGIEVDRRRIEIPEPIKMLGEHR